MRMQTGDPEREPQGSPEQRVEGLGAGAEVGLLEGRGEIDR